MEFYPLICRFDSYGLDFFYQRSVSNEAMSDNIAVLRVISK